MVKAVFYEQKGDFTDSLIRFRTSSTLSHVELLLSDGYCYTSSPRDFGVRKKKIDLSTGWRIVDIPWADEEYILDFFEETKEAAYDLKGVLIGQAFGANFHSERDFFCSEWSAKALKFDECWRYSPGLFYLVLKEMSKCLQHDPSPGQFHHLP